jgi:hypothetical protein
LRRIVLFAVDIGLRERALVTRLRFDERCILCCAAK